MKKRFLFILALCCAFSSYANTAAKLIKTRVFSQEIPQVNGTFSLKVQVKFTDSVSLNSELLIHHLPQGMAYTGGIPTGSFNSGDSVVFNLNFQYTTENLPFYFEECRLSIPYQQDGQTKQQSLLFFLYFTPYGSLELWNEHDFYALNRIWYYDKFASSFLLSCQKKRSKEKTLLPNANSRFIFAHLASPALGC